MKRAPLILCAVLSLAGCNFFKRSPTNSVSCRSDGDCGSNQVCFADGCGDPGTDILVEASTAQNAQDFRVPVLRATQDIELFAPSLLTGVISQPSSAGSAPVPYLGSVSFLITGESLLIPGLQRIFQTTLMPAAGAYSLPIQSGIYSVTVVPGELALPPVTQGPVSVEPDTSPRVDWSLPDPSSLVVIQGTLLATIDAGPIPSAMQIRAVDSSLQPISQTVPVDEDGGFAVSVLATAALSGSVELAASPVETHSLVPSKLFTVISGAGGPTLELGDYGVPFTARGSVIGSDGGAIANATVYVQGTVSGGGTFRSDDATTGTDGRFTLLTLPNDPANPFTFWAVPPQGSASGGISAPIDVTADGGVLGAFLCPDKTVLQSSVLRPDATALPGVHVTAIPVAAESTLPLPANGDDTSTDGQGNFALHLSPAVYELDFEPPEHLPRTSRFVVVRPSTGVPQVETPFDMSRGRTVTGLVTAADAVSGVQIPAPNVAVRFYRAANLNGLPASVLLAEGVTGPKGTYSVIFPTR